MRRNASQRLQTLLEGDRTRRGSVSLLAGVDEAGRGPVAGPVTAAAVILPADEAALEPLLGLDDSKVLSETERERLFAVVHDLAVAIGLGWATPQEIDEHNILNATFRAMHRAVQALDPAPQRVLIDGNRAPTLAPEQECVVGGDRTCLSIAAAALIAKVNRDRYMSQLHEQHPGYRFDVHKGYGTAYHWAAIEAWGACPEHRTGFVASHNCAAPPPADEQVTALYQETTGLSSKSAWDTHAGRIAAQHDNWAEAHQRLLAFSLWQRGKELKISTALLRRRLAWAEAWLPRARQRKTTATTS